MPLIPIHTIGWFQLAVLGPAKIWLLYSERHRPGRAVWHATSGLAIILLAIGMLRI